jgi:hypothetical protein
MSATNGAPLAVTCRGCAVTLLCCPCCGSKELAAAPPSSAAGDARSAFVSFAKSFAAAAEPSFKGLSAVEKKRVITEKWQSLSPAEQASFNAASKPLAAVTLQSSGGKPVREKRQRDPDAPKRPPTAFFIFSEAHRASVSETLRSQQPGLKTVTVETARVLGQMWKALDTAEQEQWKQRAAERAAAACAPAAAPAAAPGATAVETSAAEEESSE